MEGFEKSMKELEQKLIMMSDAMEKAFSSMGEKIASKVQADVTSRAQAAVEKVITNAEKFKNRGDGQGDLGKPVYVYRSDDGTVTKIHKDGSKRVERDVGGEKSDEPLSESDRILKILPYLDEDSLHELTVQFLDFGLETDMKKVIPFLDEDDVFLIIKKIIENGGDEYRGVKLDDVLPFADDEAIGELFKKKIKEGILDETLLPYVDEDCLHEIVKEYCNDENSTLDIDKIYPFLDEEDINLLFRSYLKRRKNGV